MDIENSSLWSEVQLITTNGPKPVSFYWKAEIHLPLGDRDVIKVLALNNVRNYESNIGDELEIEVVLPLGVYAKQIYPNRDNLEMTLTRVPLAEVGDEGKQDTDIDAERFKAVLIPDGMPNVEGSEMAQQSEDTLDLQSILNVHFQLLNKTLEKLRIVTVGGIFRQTTTENVVRGLLAKESSVIQVNGNAAIDGVDVEEASNQVKREHITIPQGTQLIRVPTFVQERCGGVYNAGIGSFLQNRIWYVYPLYDTTRLNKAERTLTLIKVPRQRYTGIERTYREEGGSVFVIGTSNSSFKDDAGTEYLNKGNGVRIPDATQFMGSGSIAKTVGNKTVMSRGKLNSEFTNGKKEDGSNNVRRSQEGVTANPFVEYSRLASRKGGIYEFTWENANASILFPGMKTRVLYLDGENVVELHGVLLSAQTLAETAGRGMTIERHITTCKLHVFVNKPPEL